MNGSCSQRNLSKVAVIASVAKGGQRFEASKEGSGLSSGFHRRAGDASTRCQTGRACADNNYDPDLHAHGPPRVSVETLIIHFSVLVVPSKQ